jgi:hypothetical protein
MVNRFALAILSLSLTSVCHAQPLTLKKSQIYKQSGTGICGYVKNKWVPVVKNGKSYKKISGSEELKALCKSLLRKTKLSLKKIPESSALFRSSNISESSFSVSAVSGTPPTLSEISQIGASNVFWRSGIVSAINSGSPSPTDCNELYGSSADGSSSGFPGCYMAQETGFVMESLIQSGTTLCYMKNFPTQEVQDGNGFSVINGSLPGGDITKLFTPPSGNSPRYVKIHIGASGQQEQEEGSSIGIFKIYGQQQNESNGDQYRYDIVFCQEGDSTAQEFERTRITLAGELITKNKHSQGGGSGEATIRAFLTLQDGELVVNPSLGRFVQFTQANGPERYKSSLVLNSNNEIENKVYSLFGGLTRKGFSIARFSGESAPSVRYLEGAYKETNSIFGNFSIATEYRDSYYASTESSEFTTRLAEVDIETDSFFQDVPVLEDASAPLSCSQEASVEIQINMNSDAMQSISSRCEAERLDGMDFCRDAALSQAEQNFALVCSLS